MTASEFIQLKIDLSGRTLDEFADYIEMPRKELHRILNSDIRQVRADKIDRICQGLEITVSDVIHFLYT